MIKGNATLQVTRDTVIAALQSYFDDRTAPGYLFKVTDILAIDKNTYGGAPRFEISITEQPVKI